MTPNLDTLAKTMLSTAYKPKTAKAAESILRNSQKEKISSIKESILDIENQMTDRRLLSVELLKELDAIIHGVERILAEVDAYGKGVVEYTDIRKEMLKKKFDLIQAKTDEKITLWKDISLLKKELREHSKELRDIENKGNMLDDLLDL